MVRTCGSEFFDSDNTEKSGIVTYMIFQTIKAIVHVVVEMDCLLRKHTSKMPKKTAYLAF